MQISQQTDLINPQIPLNFDVSSLKLKLNKEDSLIYLTEKKSYTAIASCVYEHIINDSSLTASEKIYYIIADCLALVNFKNGGTRSVKLSGKIWAAKLGCSKTKLFKMQESLENKGYFTIVKGKNDNKQDHRNIITPTLPDEVFDILKKTENKADDILPFDTSEDSTECKRSYLDRAKLFIPINYQLLLLVFASDKINSAQKITWLDFYIRSYKRHLALKANKNISDKNKYNFYFFATYKELTSTYSCDIKYLSKNITILEKQGFLKRRQLHIKRGKKDQENQEQLRQIDIDNQDRYDHSLWFFSPSMPPELSQQLKYVKNRAASKFDADCSDNDDKNKHDSLDNEITDNSNDVIKDDNIVNDDGLIDDTQNSVYKYEEDEYIDEVIDELDNGSDIDNLKTANFIDTNYNIAFSSDNSSSFNLYNNYSFVDTSFKPLDSSINPSSAPACSSFNINLNITNPISFSVPDIACIDLHLNKYKQVFNFKSTLQGNYKVAFIKFLDNFDFSDNSIKRKVLKKKDFSIRSYLIKNIASKFPKHKIEKAKKFAYSIVSKNLATGYAATLDKHELARQFICHIDNWKSKKYGFLPQEQQIDLALAVAWKAATNGTWQVPYNWAKASVLDSEYKAYQQKYQESGVLSHDIRALEKDFSKLLGYPCFDLEKRIIESSPYIPKKELLPTISEYEHNNNIDFNNDYIEQSSSTGLEIRKPKESVFLKNVEMCESLERQGYFKLELAEDGIIFKTQQVGNHKYFATVKDIQIDNEDIYYTVKLRKGTIIDYGDRYEIDFDTNLNQQSKAINMTEDKTHLLLNDY